MYLLINPDGTINFAAEHPVDVDLLTAELTLVELPDQSLVDVFNGIAIDEAIWDAAEQCIKRDPSLVDCAEGSESWCRQQAEQHILHYYPLWHQLNILRSDDKEAILTMGDFIDACRDWSNQAYPDLADLQTLRPQ
jgi:hypothetical protein